MKRPTLACIGTVTLIASISARHGPGTAFAQVGREDRIRPVPLGKVKVTGGVWADRMRINRDVTVWYDFQKCEETGRIDNFAKAGGLLEGGFEGIFYNDSDVFKVIEGAAYVLAVRPDAKLERYLDELIAKIAAAQEDDGYLYTARTLRPDDPPRGSGPSRWSNLRSSHELYNVGHLYEAAAAHYLATGKRTLLDVATRNADLIDRVFGPNQRQDVPGHEEIEIGLVKLYRVTGERRYLDLAKFFIDARGRPEGRSLYGDYSQDHKPFIEQDAAVGHAVRAGYLYAGAADVAALTGEQAYVRALDRIWQDVVSRKMALTGGIGARRDGEAFGDPYELPNQRAYNETCAAIANALWNHGMFLLHGDAKYIDVLERVIYNGFLAGVSLSGDRFFYPNPLSADGRYGFNHGGIARQAWFGTSCCPVNVVRFVPSIAGFLYAARGRSAYINLFVESTSTINLGETSVHVTQQTGYPWKPVVRITVDPDQPARFAMYVRIPGWSRGQPVPSDLYRNLHEFQVRPRLAVNGERMPYELVKGYAVVRRQWSKGDVVELEMPLRIRRVIAHEKVAADRGRVALERGPIVYSVEGIDHDSRVLDLALPDHVALTAQHRDDLLGGVTVIQGQAIRVRRGDNGTVVHECVGLTAIPYYAWAHRQPGEMAVWLPRDPGGVELPPPPTTASRSRASASHVWPSDTVEALHDQIEPGNSSDHAIPRFTWWPRRGSTEWVQYDFAKPFEVSGVAVYWFDDTGRGQCRVPKSWRVLYDDGGRWTPVRKVSAYEVEKDQFNTVAFEPVSTRALRLEVVLWEGVSAGILEWRVHPER